VALAYHPRKLGITGKKTTIRGSLSVRLPQEAYKIACVIAVCGA